jgi:CBS domain-containing protein
MAMLVREIMTREVRVASPGDNLQSAAQLMEKYDFGALPVGENDRLVGMLSDRDITIRAVARGLSPDRCKVADVMSTDVRYVFDDDSVEDAARSMSELQVRRLPVLSREKRLVGIVSLGDLAVNEPEPAGDALRSISQHPH